MLRKMNGDICSHRDTFRPYLLFRAVGRSFHSSGKNWGFGARKKVGRNRPVGKHGKDDVQK